MAPTAPHGRIPTATSPKDPDAQEKEELENLIQYVAGKLVREIEV